MFWFNRLFPTSRPARPARTAPSFRSSLRLEELDIRATPSGLDDPTPIPPTDPGSGSVTSPPDPGDPGTGGTSATPPAATAPVIDEIDAEETASGWFTIIGHVTADNPNGLTITFGGIPALTTKTTTTDASGNFTLLFQVQTNGADNGTGTAVTFANGLMSNTATVRISPT